MILGKRLKLLLDERDLTQREFGKLIGMSESTISNYVNGSRQPSLEALQAMASYLGVTADYLIGRTDDPTEYVQAKFPDKWEHIIKTLEDAGLSPEDVETAVGVLKELKKMREG